jgi:hypothetical protein
VVAVSSVAGLGAVGDVSGHKLLGGVGLTAGLESGVITVVSPSVGDSLSSSSRREDEDEGRGVPFRGGAVDDGGGVGTGDGVDVVDDESGGANAWAIDWDISDMSNDARF